MRPALALIDLDAFRHNYRLARALGGGKALAVLKADAYGHGAVACAQALDGETDGFGVACIEEALVLREAGIRAPILLLEGFFDTDELALISRHSLWTALASPWQLDALERHAGPLPRQVWLKMDTGMHRLGFAPGDYADAWRRLQALPGIDDVVAMTHFSSADELSSARTQEQTGTFDGVSGGLPGATASVANSAALLAWPQTRRDWVRPGLMLYGTSSFDGPCASADALQPVMTLSSAVIAVRDLEAGEPIGYAGSFVTRRPTRVGVVAMGYADGYPQRAPEGTPVLIDGQPGGVIGRVSMDMLTVDLTDHPQAGLGSRVEFWGAQLPVATVAAHCGTSPYSLLSGLKRTPRRYVGAGL
ncbi:alanine racemase [Luteimonas sp. RIT-PG2_3]